ncbi:MAG: hypothetical protein U0470_00550 [Anaerolineae bacterium]
MTSPGSIQRRALVAAARGLARAWSTPTRTIRPGGSSSSIAASSPAAISGAARSWCGTTRTRTWAATASRVRRRGPRQG